MHTQPPVAPWFQMLAALLLFAPQLAAAPKEDGPWGEDVGGLRVQLQVSPPPREQWHPGETLRVMAIFRNAGKEPLALAHVNNHYVALLHARMPDGKEYAWGGGHSAVGFGKRPQAGNYSVCPPGGKMFGGEWYVRLTTQDNWYDMPKASLVDNLSFRGDGTYRFQVIYDVGKPADGQTVEGAWSGKAASNMLEVKVAELPVDKRLAEPTAEQREWLDAVVAGKADASRTGPTDFLRQALALAANEGLARRIVAMAREGGAQRPVLLWLLQERVGSVEAFGIDGPYLKDYVELLTDLLEGKLPPDAEKARPFSLTSLHGADTVLRLYLREHPEDKALRDRLVAVATPCAKVSDLPPWDRQGGGGSRNAATKCGLSITTVWHILVHCGVLREGMTLEEAVKVLGKPTDVGAGREKQSPYVRWSYEWPLRSGPPGITCELKDSKVVRFHVSR